MVNVNGFGFHRFVITCAVFAESEEEAIAKVMAALEPAIQGEGALSIHGVALQKEVPLPLPKRSKKPKAKYPKKADAREVEKPKGLLTVG